MQNWTSRRKIIDWLFSNGMPVTKGLIVINIVSFLAVTLFQAGILLDFMGFTPSAALIRPWTFITYPLIAKPADLLGLVFATYWLWFAGGSLERSWGSRKFSSYLLMVSAVSSIGLFFGSQITGVPVFQIGLWLPLAAITVSFAMLNPEAQVLFAFVIPVKLKYLALISAAFVLISYRMSNILLGLFALSGCVFAYWYVMRGTRSIERKPRTRLQYEDGGRVIRIHPRRSRGLLGLYSEYRERKRLKKFLDR